MEPLIKLLNAILTPLFALIEAFFNWASPIFKKAFDWLGGFFKFLVEQIGTGLTNAFQKFGDFFKNLWSGITGVFKEAINFIIRGINTFIEGCNKLKPPAWLTNITGMTGVEFKTIPLLAEGGNIEAAGRVIVGERGPEILDLPKGARVSPLGKENIDYAKLGAEIVKAMKEAGFGQFVNYVYVDGQLSETQVVNAMNLANYRSGGR